VGWSGQEALAAVLLAERLHQRGARRRGHDLLHAGRRQFVHDGDEWGTALADVVDAKATLLAGDAAGAAERAAVLLRTFEELGDPAGQVMAHDLAGYCAEVQGDLVTSVRTHRRALDLARRSQAPEWEAAQLTRLGSVLALLGSPEAVTVLEDAVALAADLRSGANTALAENGLGLAATLAGDGGRAAEAHARALRWYERQESPAGISYSAGRLAEVVAAADSAAADVLARRAAALAEHTGDPRALAHGLEAVAFVASDPVEGARALGAARALRKATAAPLPPPLHATLLRTERALHRRLGDRLVDEMRRGAHDARRRLAESAGR
jgi:tetratricopeptide (TPR) repeat protein